MEEALTLLKIYPEIWMEIWTEIWTGAETLLLRLLLLLQVHQNRVGRQTRQLQLQPRRCQQRLWPP